jgi:hypothetical protein
VSTISARCRQMQRSIVAAKNAGLPIPSFIPELDEMEFELRQAGEWRSGDDEPGYPCPWHKVCNCTHVGCSSGFLIAETAPRVIREMVYDPEARVCPTCGQAKQRYADAAEAKTKKSRWRA